ncbi:MAG: hypothetical protein OXU77_18530 [Gammaproteobacteria bacterium]|nr:hypothetical protein [Gammaproteobacteria bacterium]MDE0443600.1 hypothetical protein [Gammaproteobacteria bacterium]
MINDLIRDGWGYHDTQSERLAGELEAADLHELKGQAPAHCLRLSNHTIGEHLGDWPRARRFAETVREATADGPVDAGFGVHLAVARYMDDDAIAAQQAEIECLGGAEHPVEAYLSVKSFLAGALAGSGRFADAGVVIAAANRLAAGLGEGAASDRSMAVANNNLASELVESEELDAEQARMMLECAEAAHTFWKRCGTWVNEERALYLLALVHNRTANQAGGLEYAQTALGVIAANGEEAVDEAFIRLAAATSQIGLSDVASAKEHLATADGLAEAWSDESLVTWYRGERRKVAAALGEVR